MAASNSFGKIYRLTTFGESHGDMIGGIIDGCPAGIFIDTAFIQKELDRRKPGQSSITTMRKETDEVTFLSGIHESISTGSPIGFFLSNTNPRKKDYEHMLEAYRPSHADFTYEKKYQHRNPYGGGRSSARETANWVVGGALAKLILRKLDVRIYAYVSQIGEIQLEKSPAEIDLTLIEPSPVRCPDIATSDKMTQYLKEIRKSGDTIGGKISCIVKNVPAGLGDPIFEKLHANIGKAMLSINAVKGFEYGQGFHAVSMKGSEHNDLFYFKDNKIRTRTNQSGGIQGGISNGEQIYFNVAFKPIPTILKDQETMDHHGIKTILKGKGRHDVCPVPRAVPIVEAMTAMVLADHLLLNKTTLL